ncbi:hypothetical protein [Geobacter sp. SVR]|uniref:hypothetical protein n=1 Tax=Geobacter sp. SVR TaxID=2495594 RepID=UPI00143EFE44|nr:hypothetical protein [Geobacter sp. SVR]BCS54768.1 hypothetical protein GSVR_30760 [Geobacter sp. SVR]GCF86424.1 hypothetical protein GSbR_30240 [Geobacter sp. SVR]
MEPKMQLFHDECQKPFSELPELKADESGRTWSFQEGGRGLERGQWSISVFRGEITDIYPLPESINSIINLVEKWGQDKARNAMKAALGL